MFKPEYAEIHYKFKLPWSLLYKKEPEIIVDAPFQIVPGKSVKLFLIIREGNRFPVFLKNFSADFICGKTRIRKWQPLNELVNSAFRFIEIDCGKMPAGNYTVETQVQIKINGKEKCIHRFNLSGLTTTPLRICVLQNPIPKPAGFIAGETHAHTYISADPVEFGASPAVLQKAAKSVGLDFVFCTDHSYDFAFDENDYMIRADANVRFEKLRKEIAALAPSPSLIAGEEISAGNSQNKNVHLLFPGNPFYVPGEGDCGRKWLNNKPTLSIAEIVNKTNLPCIAAHPKETMSRLERFIFRRGDWSANDLQKNSKNPIVALEFWNGSRDAGFYRGKNFWISELEKGNFILPFGGNAAHGDLNEFTGVQIPLFRLKRSHAHIFGKVRTVLFGENPLKLFCGMNLYVTDGPALWWTTSQSEVTFHFLSNSDFGSQKSIRIFGKKFSDEKEKEIEKIDFQKISEFELTISLARKDFQYLRAEAETENGNFALTSACPANADNVHT